MEDEDGTRWARFGPGEFVNPADWIAVEGEPDWTAIDERWIIMSLSGPEDVEGKELTVTVRITDDEGTDHFDTHELTTFFVR